MKKQFLGIIAAASIGMLFTGCMEKASAQDVEQMCKKLGALRAGGETVDAEKVAEDMKTCQADPMITGASKAVATCRISAADVDAFWNKCK